MRTFTAILFLFTTFILHAEEKYKQKGNGWETWKKFEEYVLAGRDKEAKSLLGFVFLSSVEKTGLSRAKKNFSTKPAEFIREFQIQEKTFVVFRDYRKTWTVMVEPKGEAWTLNLAMPIELKGPEDEHKIKEVLDSIKTAKIKAGLARVKSRLKHIAGTVQVYYSFPEMKDMPIPSMEELEIIDEVKIYDHPETGKEHKFLFVTGVKFSGSAKELLAVTDVEIMGQHWAVFDDGRVRGISKEDFDKHKFVLGLEKFEGEKLTRPQIEIKK